VATKNSSAPSGRRTWTRSAAQQRKQFEEKQAAAANLIQSQKQLKRVAQQLFVSHGTKNGARVITKDMGDYKSVEAHFESYYTFYPESKRPMKAAICCLPLNTPAEDVAERPVDFGLEVVSIRQMSTARQSPEGTASITLPLFLVTLPRTTKSQDSFKLSNLWHISIKAESSKSQDALTQCYNCQKFGHVWASCKRPPRCLWCGGCHLHKDCPEKEKGFVLCRPGLLACSIVP
jgi:hypothetical protein